VQIQEAARILGVSEQTLRNWDRAGKLPAGRHPINGYRLYKVADLHALLSDVGASIARPPASREHEQLSLLAEAEAAHQVQPEVLSLPPCHWRPEVALDPKHRPQIWTRPSTTVRRDWRKYPQEAHVIDGSGKRYRRFSVEEIAILQGFDTSVVDVDGLADRERIAALGDSVPPPLASAVVGALEVDKALDHRTALEICAGIGGLAEGAASVGLEHLALTDFSDVCVRLLTSHRSWDAERVHLGDVREFDFERFAGGVGLLSGGPPCQPWSQSGRHGGMNDARDLLSTLPTIVSLTAPEAFVFENVPGLVSPQNLGYLEHVIEGLQAPDPGSRYGVLAGVLNAADYGVPQTRRRLFILGLRDRPAADVAAWFDRIAGASTHSDPAQGIAGRLPWRTIGDVLEQRDDPGGWRRWIGVAA
jgi:site-specific DNA-cytosine methylase